MEIKSSPVYNFYAAKIKEDYIINITLILKLLHLKQDDIEDIHEVYINDKRVDIDITLKPKKIACDYCNSLDIVSKGRQHRKEKHSIYTKVETYINFHFRRYKCRNCGKTFNEENSFYIGKHELSIITIMDILDELCSWNATYQEIAHRYKISNTTVMNVMDSFAATNVKPFTEVLSIDEVYLGKNRKKPYACILLDHTTGTLLDVREGRDKSSLRNYFLGKSQAEREKVHYFTMDMWDSYLDLAIECFPNVTVAIDSFHVMKNLSKALHDVKCRVMGRYEWGTTQYYLLKKYRYLLYTSRKLSSKKYYNKKLKTFVSEQDAIRLVLDIDDELASAYNFYHAYQHFNKFATIDDAEEKFDNIMEDLTDIVKVPELRENIIMLQKWKKYILNSFIYVNGKRLSNGPMESTNNRIKRLKKAMNGISNFARFRRRCFLVINKSWSLKNDTKNDVKRKQKPRGKYKQ